MAFKKYLVFFMLVITINIWGENMNIVLSSFEKLSKYGLKENETYLVIKVELQKLFVCKNTEVIDEYDISSGAKGVGNVMESYKTPLGSHKIAGKYGDNEPIGTIFEGKKSMNITTKIYYEPVDTPMDYVTTRIINLEGLEEGINKGGNVDTLKRFIYIHGTQEEGLIGKPASKGCIRMRNDEVITLFNQVHVGTFVEIIE